MGRYTFQWLHPAHEVYVTGTFDNWSRSVKLEKSAEGHFRKDVELPETNERVLYKFIVDGNWTIDPSAPQEDDGSHNINNVLQPEIVKPLHPSTSASTNAIAGTGGTTAMSGITPESTTAGIAGNIPKETNNATESAPRKVSQSEASGPVPFMSTLGPESTTAQLAKNVPLEPKRDTPGGFPETPGGQTPGMDEQVSINPLPATDGIGNPIHLQPGEKVPNPDKSINSGVTTDKAGYEKDASDPSMAALASARGSIGTQPVQVNPPVTGGAPIIQSAAPTSTTAALAANVPLEKSKSTAPGNPHEPAPEVPEVVKRSLSDAHRDAEAAGYEEAIKEKKEVEQELLQDVKRDDSAGEPAPVVTAATSSKAPAATQPLAKGGDVSPRTQEPAEGYTAAAPPQPTVTTGPTETTVPKTTGPTQAQPQPSTTQAQQPSTTKQTETPKDKKKKNRVSGFFSKLKEKLK
ncbi:predicted protein [Uncinocarpus reesii 1704]|uniref:AMP-activated protein kinase glycogen-binding domain-containing protein n=1 Tax=Uncinocarpus reesii (strain UAMH 1704) TaxID=336963 RepID=C4JK33_UNCRE|nr:uncharacterized protein UREG_01990 [Uncinocarpus reesii 1704]EEP77141.1 predicted protein [Uncinocarpus reesii 1704]